MIPKFDRRGYLPPGIHPAREDEVLLLFSSGSRRRKTLGDKLRGFIGFVRSCGAVRFLLDGSFVTDKTEPADYDCIVVLPTSFDENSPQADMLSNWEDLNQKYAADAYVVNEADNENLNWWIDFFGTDRSGYAKGLVEVLL